MESPLRFSSDRPGNSNNISPGGARSPGAPQPEASIRVLVISDLLLMRAGFHHVLQSSGIVLVGEATTCEEAVSIASRERPDIVLVDLDLRADAFRCVEAIVSAVPASRIIALSDRTHAADHRSLWNWAPWDSF